MSKSLVFRRVLIFLLVAGLCLICDLSRAGLWYTAYLNSYDLFPSGGVMDVTNVDYTVASHLIHFAIVPNNNGTLNASENGVTTAQSTYIVAQTHAAGKKALICVGGAGTITGYRDSTTSTYLGTFVTNIVNFVTTYGYDGVDIDWEPIATTDNTQFTNFVVTLRAALKAKNPQALLTVPVPVPYPIDTTPSIYASIQNQFDQINLMTYDLSGPYSGWITWFNSPIYSGGTTFPSTKALVPSIDWAVSNYVAAGIATNKLGIGSEFYGFLWQGGTTTNGGVSLPRQSWTSAPSLVNGGDFPPYNTLMAVYYQSNLYHWDTNAQAAYLSITNSNSANNEFLSYDDDHSCQAKVSYARNLGLGGVMIFDIEGGYLTNQTSGSRNSLFQSIKQALATPSFTSIQATNGQDIQFGFSSSPLAAYRVQSTSNLTSGVWNTVTNNVVGAGGLLQYTGGVLQVTDPGALNQPQRFYRIKTPP